MVQTAKMNWAYNQLVVLRLRFNDRQPPSIATSRIKLGCNQSISPIKHVGFRPRSGFGLLSFSVSFRCPSQTRWAIGLALCLTICLNVYSSTIYQSNPIYLSLLIYLSINMYIWLSKISTYGPVPLLALSLGGSSTGPRPEPWHSVGALRAPTGLRGSNRKICCVPLGGRLKRD